MSAVADATTALFVPGDRPDRFAKARAAGADCVLLDLEDAVAPDAKDAARAHVAEFLRAEPPASPPLLVRVNASGTPWADADRDALAALAAGGTLAGVVVPKAEDPAELTALADRLTAAAGAPVAVVALVESARGVLAAPALAAARGVTRLALGALDLGLDLGAAPGSATLAAARAALVLASAAAGTAGAWDTPSTAVRDTDEVARESAAARDEGFGGKLCIHPAQVDVVRRAFAPSPEELAWSRRVVDADAGSGAAVQVDGRMVDRPVVDRARALLARAAAGAEVAR